MGAIFVLADCCNCQDAVMATDQGALPCSDSENESVVDSDEAEEEGSDDELEDEEEEGKDWDELEEEAKRYTALTHE